MIGVGVLLDKPLDVLPTATRTPTRPTTAAAMPSDMSRQCLRVAAPQPLSSAIPHTDGRPGARGSLTVAAGPAWGRGVRRLPARRNRRAVGVPELIAERQAHDRGAPGHRHGRRRSSQSSSARRARRPRGRGVRRGSVCQARSGSVFLSCCGAFARVRADCADVTGGDNRVGLPPHTIERAHRIGGARP